MSSPPRSNDLRRPAGPRVRRAGEVARSTPAGAPTAIAAPSTQAVNLDDLDDLAGEALALFCWSDVQPLRGVLAFVDWRLCGAISRAVQGGLFGAEPQETLLLPAAKRMGLSRLFVFGLGPRSAWNIDILRQGCRRAVDVMQQAGTSTWRLACPACLGDVRVEQAFILAVSDTLPAPQGAILVERL